MYFYYKLAAVLDPYTTANYKGDTAEVLKMLS